MSVTIIAEAGLNFSSYQDALQLAETAKNCGADIVKYQTHFNWKYPMLTKEQWKWLKEYCDEIGIIFMSTAWSFEAIDFLDDIGMTHWKIPSSELTNKYYMEKIAEKMLKYTTEDFSIYASDGFGDNYDIPFLSFGRINRMKCISKYPTVINEIDFREIDLECGSNYIGYSDHTNDIYAPIIAVSHGAQVIEKHFCLSHPCIDDAVSITPDKFKEMVDVIRQLENYKEPVIPPEILALKNRVML